MDSGVKDVAEEVAGAAVDLGNVVISAEKLDAPSVVAGIKSLHDRLTRIEQHLHDFNPRTFLHDWIGKL